MTATDPLTLALELFASTRQCDPDSTLGEIVDQVVELNPAARGQRPRLFRELIKLDLEQRSAASEAPMIPLLEAYLEASPGVTFGDDSLLELIEHEYCVRYHSHAPLELETYAERFPNLGAEAVRRLRNLREDLAVESSLRSLFDQPAPPLADDSDPSPGDAAAPPAEFDDSLVMDALRQVRPFSELTQHVRQAVADKLVLQPFEAGDVLLRQGEVADSMLIVLDGTAEVTVEEGGRVHSIARLEKNTVVGEMGLFTRELRSANVVAVRAGCAGIIGRDDFEHIAGRYPRLSIALSELIADRVGTLTIDCLCGKHVNRYLVKHRVGRGAMGIVYAATDEETGTPVALKMLRHDLNFDRLATLRFHQEAELVQGLEHPNIVRVFGEFEAFGTLFICMELCEGVPLSDLLRRNGALPPETVRAVAGQMASGLLRAHRAGVAHRDLKPANVLLTRDGLAKLADFGLARSLTDDLSLTQIGQMVGTPRYMAPEQLNGERGDDRSDLFSLGCIVFELVAGRPLFQARKFGQLIEERMNWSLPAPSALAADPEVYALLAGCLREAAEERAVDLEAIASWSAPIEWSSLYAVDSPEPVLDRVAGARIES